MLLKHKLRSDGQYFALTCPVVAGLAMHKKIDHTGLNSVLINTKYKKKMIQKWQVMYAKLSKCEYTRLVSIMLA